MKLRLKPTEIVTHLRLWKASQTIILRQKMGAREPLQNFKMSLVVNSYWLLGIKLFLIISSQQMVRLR